MFLQLAHTRLEIYKYSQLLILECYKVTNLFPTDERYAIIQQIRRAAVSVHLNLAEGASRTSAVERKRFFEISRSSVIEVDAAIGVAFSLGYANSEQLKPLGELILRTFKLLTGMVK